MQSPDILSISSLWCVRSIEYIIAQICLKASNIKHESACNIHSTERVSKINSILSVNFMRSIWLCVISCPITMTSEMCRNYLSMPKCNAGLGNLITKIGLYLCNWSAKEVRVKNTKNSQTVSSLVTIVVTGITACQTHQLRCSAFWNRTCDMKIAHVKWRSQIRCVLKSQIRFEIAAAFWKRICGLNFAGAIFISHVWIWHRSCGVQQDFDISDDLLKFSDLLRAIKLDYSMDTL